MICLNKWSPWTNDLPQQSNTMFTFGIKLYHYLKETFLLAERRKTAGSAPDWRQTERSTHTWRRRKALVLQLEQNSTCEFRKHAKENHWYKNIVTRRKSSTTNTNLSICSKSNKRLLWLSLAFRSQFKYFGSLTRNFKMFWVFFFFAYSQTEEEEEEGEERCNLLLCYVRGVSNWRPARPLLQPAKLCENTIKLI